MGLKVLQLNTNAPVRQDERQSEASELDMPLCPLALGEKKAPQRLAKQLPVLRQTDRFTFPLGTLSVCVCECACVAAWLCVTNQARKKRPCENRLKRQWPAEQLLQLPTNRVQPLKSTC